MKAIQFTFSPAIFTSLNAVLYNPGKVLLTMLLILVASINVWAHPCKETKHASAPTVSVSPSSLFFSAVEGQPSDAKQVQVIVNGVSPTAVTTITAPDVYSIISSTGTPIKTFSFSGDSVLRFFVRFDGSDDEGDNFDRLLSIKCTETNTVTVSLAAAVSPNPSIFPSALNFSTINDAKPSLPLELDITISAVSSTVQTFVIAPAFYELLVSPTGTSSNTIILTGPGTFKLFVRFSGSINTGIFSDDITVSEPVRGVKIVPLKTVVSAVPTPSANPGSLTGFTAVQNVSASAVQSFNLSVKGLPVQGNPFITVTAPTGYSVALSATASFVNAFVIFAKNGIISTNVFARLNSNNPVGTVNGNISITGSQINSITVPVTGTVTPKPLPTLTLDKTSLAGFTTTINKASATQSYNLQATNLDAGIAATVKAPTGYEVSLTNLVSSVFSSQLTVNQATAGTINANIFVRLKSQPTAGTITGSLQNLVAGLSKNVTVSGTVTLPPSLSVNPTSITGFLTVQNQASPSKIYTIIASNLAAGVKAIVTAPVNYEVTLQGSGSFASALTLTQNGTGSINRIVEVRLKATTTTGTITGAIQNTVSGLVKTVGVSGSVAAPTLATSTTSLTFTAVKNQASAVKSYKVIATNLASGNTATITSSSAYEISKDSIVFTNSLTLPINVTNGINTSVFVRLKATATAGTITGSIQNSVAGLSKIISLSAAVATPTLSVNPISLTGFVTSVNHASATKSYNLIAVNLATGLTAKATAPTGYEMSIQGTPTFSTSLTLTQTTTGIINRIILVRLKGQAGSGSITGNIANSVSGLSKTVAVSGTITTTLLPVSESTSPLEKLSVSSPSEIELFIKTFPDPVTDQLTVEFLAPENNPAQIRLLDLHGNVLLTQEAMPAKDIGQMKLSLAKQHSGLYFVEVISGTKHKTVQIIKQ